jgi:hypothetical protein
MKLYNLKDQNLLRHCEIQKLIGSRGFLMSDSVGILNLLLIVLFLKRKLFFIHALELYSVSYGACLSEYQCRWLMVSDQIFLKLKSYVGYVFAIFRVYLLRRLAARSGIMIISSEMRKDYLINEGVNFSVVVIKNKPVFSPDEINKDIFRSNSIIALIGNMYSAKEDFMSVLNFALINDMNIHCYGVSPDDEVWIGSMNFENVKIFNRVNQGEVAKILQSSQFALCLYSSASVNNEYSSSSKVFELLYYGVVPIISNNKGLRFELNSLGANFLQIDDNLKNENFHLNNNSLMYSDKCQFSSELHKLNDFLINFDGRSESGNFH